MKKLIDADALYEQIVKKEKLAQQRVLDTPSRMPNGDLNPSAIRYFTQLDERTQMKFMIADAPTVDIEPHWIPCSERIPNDDKDYLVTDGESMAVGYYRTDAKAWDNVNFGWLEHREETCGLKPVVAWMPLPKPYEGDKE